MIERMERSVENMQAPRRIKTWRWIRSGLKGDALMDAFCGFWADYTYRYCRMQKQAREIWPLL